MERRDLLVHCHTNQDTRKGLSTLALLLRAPELLAEFPSSIPPYRQRALQFYTNNCVRIAIETRQSSSFLPPHLLSSACLRCTRGNLCAIHIVRKPLQDKHRRFFTKSFTMASAEAMMITTGREIHEQGGEMLTLLASWHFLPLRITPKRLCHP